MPATAVTPTGVRDGDPDALAALCSARGDAVLAYCQKVAGNAAAVSAAAEAFGHFRAAVVATGNLAALNPEAMLVDATRHAAARHARGQAEGVCADVPELLACRADRSISPADLDRLESHLESCWACRAPVARFKAAERAYRDPPGIPVPPDVAGAIVSALVAAAPRRGRKSEPPPVPAPATPPASNGASRPARHVAAIEDTTETSAIDDATDEQLPLDDDPYDTPSVVPVSNGSRLERPSVAASLMAFLGLRPVAEKLGRPAPATEPRLVAGTHLPRPQRASGPASPGPRAAAALRPAVLMPVALVAAALILALLVAGVFSGSDPASSPKSTLPAVDAESTAKKPKIVVVPNAQQASAAAVELAKERARAKRRRDAEVASRPTEPDATPDVTPDVTPDAPAPAAPPPPPPPPAARTPTANNPSKPAPTRGSGNPRVGTGNGATGTDQLPTPDTSSVPELAPPDDTTLPPG